MTRGENVVGDITMKKAETLVEALPYIQKYKGKTFVVKVGGGILRIPESKRSILQDVAFLNAVGVKTVIVCGAGPAISEEIERRGKKVTFVEGLRVTDADVLQIVVDMLGAARDDIRDTLEKGFSTHASALTPAERPLTAQKIHWQKGAEVIDLGFVGQVTSVSVDAVNAALDRGVVVFAPLGVSPEGQIYNVNGDTASATVAQALGAEKLIFLTGVPGVMRNISNADTLISILSVDQADSLIKEGVIQQGMIPKVRGAVASLRGGVKKVHIISGNVPHSLVLEVFTDQGVGTEIVHANGSGK
jgi:acetylglutamate kinase